MWIFLLIVVDFHLCLFRTCIDREFLILFSCFLGSGGISMSQSILLADYVAEDKETITLTVGYASFISLYDNFWKRPLDFSHPVLFCVDFDYELLLTCLLRLTEGNRICICSVAFKAQRVQLNSCSSTNIRTVKIRIWGSSVLLFCPVCLRLISYWWNENTFFNMFFLPRMKGGAMELKFSSCFLRLWVLHSLQETPHMLKQAIKDHKNSWNYCKTDDECADQNLTGTDTAYLSATLEPGLSLASYFMLSLS